jgi:hypothetical protein
MIVASASLASGMANAEWGFQLRLLEYCIVELPRLDR